MAPRETEADATLEQVSVQWRHPSQDFCHHAGERVIRGPEHEPKLHFKAAGVYRGAPESAMCAACEVSLARGSSAVATAEAAVAHKGRFDAWVEENLSRCIWRCAEIACSAEVEATVSRAPGSGGVQGAVEMVRRKKEGSEEGLEMRVALVGFPRGTEEGGELGILAAEGNAAGARNGASCAAEAVLTASRAEEPGLSIDLFRDHLPEKPAELVELEGSALAALASKEGLLLRLSCRDLEPWVAASSPAPKEAAIEMVKAALAHFGRQLEGKEKAGVDRAADCAEILLSSLQEIGARSRRHEIVAATSSSPWPLLAHKFQR